MTRRRSISRTLLAVSLTLSLLPTVTSQAPWESAPIGLAGNDLDTVFDSARSRVVAQGEGGRLWRWTGASWEFVAEGGPAADVLNTEMVYDSVRDRLVFFDGESRETWEFDGTLWEHVATTPAIPIRLRFGLAYDPVRQRVVMHGGRETFFTFTDPAYSDTWEWDGATWSLVTDTGPTSSEHAMEFDSASGKVLLFGVRPGLTATSAPETWLFDGTTWTQVVTNEPETGFQALAPNPTNGELVLFAGPSPFFAGPPSLWNWDGASWIQVANSDPGFLFSGNPNLVVDSAGSAFTFANPSVASGWDGVEWTEIRAQPFDLLGASACFDRSRNRVVLVTPQADGTTWEAEDAWVPQDTANRPVRTHPSFTFDEHREVSVLFGGVDPISEQALGDTWEWDGATWSTVSVAGPSPRSRHAAVFDAARNEVVLFGGLGSDGVQTLGDTWTWDGTTWTQHTPATSPPPRAGHAMAYDRRRERVVMFGGLSVPTATWEWDGADWVESPAMPNGPEARSGHGMAYDEVRARVVLHGGREEPTILNDSSFFDTWDWDGRIWRRLSETSPAGFEHLVYFRGEDRRARMLRSQGFDGDVSSWRLVASSVGTGCGGALEPSLQLSSDRPSPGTTVGIALDQLPSTGTAFNLAGFEPAAPALQLDVLGLPGCELLIADPLTVSSFGLDFLLPSGELTWNIAIPDVPEAVNVRVVVQSIVASEGEFRLTEGGVFVIDPPVSVPPTITSVFPLSGSPGTVVTIQGDDFTIGTSVVLDGVELPTTLVDFDELTFTIPASVPCDADLTVQNPGGQAASTVFNPAPTITNTVNDSGPASGGNVFIIVGMNLSGAMVTIGGVASTSSGTDASLIVTPPPGVPGPAEVIVTAPNGCSATTTYTYL